MRHADLCLSLIGVPLQLSELQDPDTIKKGYFILLDQDQGKTFNFPSRVPPKRIDPVRHHP